MLGAAKIGASGIETILEFGANDILATDFGDTVIRPLNLDHWKLEPLKLEPLKLGRIKLSGLVHFLGILFNTLLCKKDVIAYIY